MPVQLRPITPETAGFSALEAESLRCGFHMLRRLAENWSAFRFDRPGEMLRGAFAGVRLIGVGGRSLDPHEDDPRIGRVRHVYVMEERRGSGVGRLIVENVIRDADRYFTRLNLRAPPAAFGFYEHLGFAPVADRETVTHHLLLP